MSATSECGHYWMPVAGHDREAVKICVFCGRVCIPEAIDVSNLIDTRRWSGFGLYSEQQKLLERLRMRWEDGQDPGIPEKLQRLL